MTTSRTDAKHGLALALALGVCACTSEPIHSALETATTVGGQTSSGGVSGSDSGTSGTSGTSSTSSTSSGGSAGAGGGQAGLTPIPGRETFDCSPPEGSVPELQLSVVASGFVDPLFVAYAPGDRRRLFVVEQAGRVRLLVDGVLESTPFLDIRDRVERGGDEQGLLGLAFHPDYLENGRFYVNYSAVAGQHGMGQGATIVSEFSVGSDLNQADADSERFVLGVPQPYGNHNGGMLSFGPDGFLFIGMGDGGSGGDPHKNGQNLSTLLGSLLRIDVDARDAGEYGIPVGNLPGAANEIWDYGLRNPWRFSFDGCTGDLYIGDVGQDSWEEVNVVPSGEGHKNFGWNVREGAHCFQANSCDDSGMTDPLIDYGRDAGVSVTGGYVYRGSRLPGLRGTYFYADYGSGRVFAFEYLAGQLQNQREITGELGSTNAAITSFGQDADGEVYLVRRYGSIERIEAR